MSEYTPELGEAICEQVMDGASLETIAVLPGMPSKRTILRWLAANKDFEQMFFLAKRAWVTDEEHALDAMTQEAIDWAKSADPKETAVSAVVNAYNNRAQHIKWKMATLYRERYGEKVGLEHSGEVNISLADAISKARKRRDEC